MPRGAAGSARDAVSTTEAQTLVVAEGTVIPTVDLRELLLQHQTSGACVTVVVHCEARRYGSPGLHVPSGIYVFNRAALEAVPAHGFCDIKEKLIPQLYARGARIVAYENAEAAPRVLDAATYMAANEWMIEQVAREPVEQDGYARFGTGLVHRDAFIADDAAIVGPVIVGPGAQVQSGSVIVGPTSIGRDATIASGAFVSRSAVWRRSFIGERAAADRCIVGDDAVIAPGSQSIRRVVTANRRRTAAELDWLTMPSDQMRRKPSLDVGARLGRLVFGASWSRSPAVQ
jgi:NDP-sugar pyrophosphorylase family protein